MWGCPFSPETTDRWAQQKHSPPYISSTPSVMHFSIEKGDMLVFCSDGLRSSLKGRGVTGQDVGKTIMSLAGVDLLDAEALLSYEKAIGHSFIPSADINNIADRVIRNLLFGLDNYRMAKETMATMNAVTDYLRDLSQTPGRNPGNNLKVDVPYFCIIDKHYIYCKCTLK